MSKKNNTNTTTTITFSIEKHIADLRKSESENGWTRELNIVKWGDRDACYDIRDWNKDHTKMSKGLSFSEEELKALAEAIDQTFRKKPAPRRAAAAR